jgi:2',3'-cyclic-nucleotide 2'-phosphodiesterase (5'-nucleotidase family)
MGLLVAAATAVLTAGSRSGDSWTLTILYTNNTNGNLAACDCGDVPMGGLARRMTVFRQVREENPRTLAVDAGDLLEQFGFRRAQDSVVMALYPLLAYDAVTIGDNEFANGRDFFERNVSEARLPFTSVNLRFDSTGPPTAIRKNVNGLNVAVLGYTPASSFAYSTQRTPLPFRLGSESNLASAVAAWRDSSDVIVLLSHEGYEADVELARRYPEIDVIVGSHSQMEIKDSLREGETILVQAGGNGTHVGRLDLTIRDRSIVGFENGLIPLDSTVADDPGMAETIERFLEQPH